MRSTDGWTPSGRSTFNTVTSPPSSRVIPTSWRLDDTALTALYFGPGVRFWATPWLALAYTAQLSFTNLSGALTAFSPSSTLGPPDYNFDNSELALVGRFTVLAIF